MAENVQHAFVLALYGRVKELNPVTWRSPDQPMGQPCPYLLALPPIFDECCVLGSLFTRAAGVACDADDLLRVVSFWWGFYPLRAMTYLVASLEVACSWKRRRRLAPLCILPLVHTFRAEVSRFAERGDPRGGAGARVSDGGLALHLDPRGNERV